MSIVEFYRDQEIFITGGSGFIGKVTIEKVLRSLPNIAKIYVLIRSKKGKTADERLQEILKIPLFRRVQEEQPQNFKKVVAVDGDCSELGLGISSANLEKIRNVTLILHAAASVRFDDHLKPAVLLNTRGTYELVKIAETLSNLKAFIHVSTTYAHPEQKTLEEKIYPPYADWRTTIKLAETYDLETLNIYFAKYSQGQPNSYTFTKSLSEHIINDYRHKLPVAIVRPSIVISSAEEPFPGWVDNFNGPIGMLMACGAGIMRTNYSNPDVISDFMPVDVCAKSLLVAAYKLATQPSGGNGGDMEVYNCSNSSISYLSTGQIITLGKKLIAKNPFEKSIWIPEGGITRCAPWHYFRLITLQIIPSILLDSLMRLSKYPPFLLKLQRRIHSTCNALNIFINTEWVFINANLKAMENILQSEERSIFSFIESDFDQIAFFEDALRGAKEFLLKEPREARPGAHMRFQIYRVLHYLFQFIGVYYISRYLLRSLIAYVNSA